MSGGVSKDKSDRYHAGTIIGIIKRSPGRILQRGDTVFEASMGDGERAAECGRNRSGGATPPTTERSRLPATAPELMAVVKADAYGHGAIEVTRALRRRRLRPFRRCPGCGEARELRTAGLHDRIYLLGGLSRGARQKEIVEPQSPHHSLFDAALVAPLGRAVEAQARANFPIHLKIDTGATRLGILPGELNEQVNHGTRTARRR